MSYPIDRITIPKGSRCTWTNESIRTTNWRLLLNASSLYYVTERIDRKTGDKTVELHQRSRAYYKGLPWSVERIRALLSNEEE